MDTIESIAALTQNGKYVESWKPSFEKFIPIGDTYKPKNYLLQFPIWIQADQAVRLMFSSNNSVDGAVFDICEYFSFDAMGWNQFLKLFCFFLTFSIISYEPRVLRHRR